MILINIYPTRVDHHVERSCAVGDKGKKDKDKGKKQKARKQAQQARKKQDKQARQAF